MRQTARRVAIVVVILAMVVSPAAQSIGVSPVGQASANTGTSLGFQDCSFWDSAVMAFYNGLFHPNEQGVCRFNPTDTVTKVQQNASLTDVYNGALKTADLRANNERLSNTLINSSAFAKSSIREQNKMRFLRYYLTPNMTESTAVSQTRANVTSAYRQNVRDLLARYNRDVGNAQSDYTRLQQLNNTTSYHVYSNGTELNTTGGVQFSIPTSLNDTGNGTSVTVDGVTAQVATVTVNGTAYTYQNGLAITVSDPTGNGIPAPVVGKDNSHDYGATATDYTPAITPAQADYIVAPDGSGNATTLSSATASGGYLDTHSNKTVYVEAGNYTVTRLFPGTNNTIVAAPGVTVNTTSSNTVIDGSGSSFTIDGGTWSVLLPGAPTDFHNVTATKLSNSFSDVGTVTGSLIPGNAAGAYGPTNAYARFVSYTQSDVPAQVAQQTDMLASFGTSSSGYLNTVWSALQAGTINVTDIVSYQDLYSSAIGGKQLDSRNWINSQFAMAGLSQNLNSTVVVSVQPNSTVYANGIKTNAVTLSSAKTYSGTLSAANQPANGWSVNQTYDTANYGGVVWMVYSKTTTKMVNGSLVTSTAPAKIAIRGQFKITELYNANGTVTTHVAATTSPNTDPYNKSAYLAQMQAQNTLMKQYLQKIQNASSGGGGTVAPGTCGVNIRIPVISNLTGWTMCTGITSLFVSGFVLVLLGILGFVLLGEAVRVK